MILTNGINWHIYKVYFRQPIDKSLVYDFNLLQVDLKEQPLLDCLGNLSREGFTQSSMNTFWQQQQATSKFSLAALLLSPPLLQALKRELRKVSPSIKVDEDFLKMALQNDVLKREAVESDEAKQAGEFIKRALKAASKLKPKSATPSNIESQQEITVDIDVETSALQTTDDKKTTIDQ